MKCPDMICSLLVKICCSLLFSLVFEEFVFCNGEDFVRKVVNVGDNLTLICEGHRGTDSFRVSKKGHSTVNIEEVVNADYFAFYSTLIENIPTREELNNHTTTMYKEDENGTGSFHISFTNISFSDSSNYTCSIAADGEGYAKTTTFLVRVFGCTCSSVERSNNKQRKINVRCSVEGLHSAENPQRVRLLDAGDDVDFSDGSFTYPTEEGLPMNRTFDIQLNDILSNLAPIRCSLPPFSEPSPSPTTTNFYTTTLRINEETQSPVGLAIGIIIGIVIGSAILVFLFTFCVIILHKKLVETCKVKQGRPPQLDSSPGAREHDYTPHRQVPELTPYQHPRLAYGDDVAPPPDIDLHIYNSVIMSLRKEFSGQGKP